MLTPEFKAGIACLARHHFTYDILILPDQLGYATKLAEEFPEQKFVLDHLAKPQIAAGHITKWEIDIRQLAKHSNVWCKASGLVTEANGTTGN